MPESFIFRTRATPDAGCAKQNGSETEMPSLESDYEIGALIVYERRDLWFRVASPSGSAWLRPSDTKAFLPYPELLQERLSYLPAGWDGILRTKPELSAPAIQLEQAWRNELERGVNIDYLGTAKIGAEPWLHVQLKTESCGASIPDAVPHAGWIPAYRATGAVSAWFFSRGC